MTGEVGTDTAHDLPTLIDAMMGVHVADILDDPALLHAAIIARRDWHEHASKLLTRWADSVRAREVERLGSQRKAAAGLGVSRGAVRPKK